MDFLPLFFRVSTRRALVFGDSAAAARKIEVLNRAACAVTWVGGSDAALAKASCVNPDLVGVTDAVSESDWDAADLVIVAGDDTATNLKLSNEAKRRGLDVNVANQADLSTFIFPSIIDRSPVLAAVSSSGELPVLTRLLRSRLEAAIPHAFGRVAELARDYQEQVKAKLGNVNARRRFWETHLEGHFAELIFSGKESSARHLLEDALLDLDQKQADTGEVYLVGAGPGDPDLLTFKALRLIRQADIVLYDRLVSPEIMALVRQDAEKVNVGKERSKHTVPQESINQLLVRYALEGRRVLRLKGGDPFIFGRGGEEIETLAEHKIPFQVVPGITAAAGCSSYAGIPLTHRDYAQSVRFVTGHLKDDSHNLPWKELVYTNQTLVFYMGLSALETICTKLIQNGMSEAVPAALISKGTTRDQKVLTATVGTLYAKFCKSDIRAPSIIIVGEVVKLREKLKWRDT